MEEPVVKRTKENLARYYDACEECLKEHRKQHKLPSDYSCSCAWSIDNEMCPDIEQKYQKFKEDSKMGKILKRLERVKDGFKFLKSYVMHYEVDGEPYQYELVSRNDLQDPSQLGQSTNAIAIVPIFRNMEILVCREFRYAINDYCYEFPAGLIDEGETPEAAAIRELKEETGLDVLEVILTLPAGYSSAGMTDEKVAVVFCLVDGTIQDSTGKEEIHCQKMTFDDALLLATSQREQLSCRFQLLVTALAMADAYDCDELIEIIKTVLG